MRFADVQWLRLWVYFTFLGAISMSRIIIIIIKNNAYKKCKMFTKLFFK